MPVQPVRLTLSTDALTVMPEPIGLLVAIDRQEDLYAWTQGSTVLRPLPDLKHGPGMWVFTAAADGQSLLFTRADREDGDAPMMDRVRHLGTYRWPDGDSDTAVRILPARPGREQESVTASNPAGPGLARLISWRDAPPGAPRSFDDQRSALELVDGAGQARELLRWNGQASALSGDDQRLQWSPSGDLLAADWTDTPGPRDTALVDPATGRLLDVVKGVLTGSASFSPDGSTLLLSENHVAVMHHLPTGRRRPIPLVPGPQGSDQRVGTPRLLGFADNDHLLFLTQRGKTMTLHRAPLDAERTDPDIVPLLRWTGGEDMYVTITRPTPNFWMF